MGIEENSVDGSGALGEEVRRQTENDLIKQFPDLRKNPALLKMMVEAVGGVGGSALRPSEALDSKGRVHGSDLGQDKEFFTDPSAMESYRKANMGNGFQLPDGGFHTQQDIREMDPARARASEQPQEGMTPGQAWVRKATAGMNPAVGTEKDSFIGNQDRNDAEFGAGGKTVADDDVTPAGGPRGGGPPWIRNIPAAGRSGIRRTR